MAKRFYQVAFDLGVAPRSFIRELAGVGLSVGNQMVVVTDDLEIRIRDVYEQLHPSEPIAPPAEAAAEPVPTEAEAQAEGGTDTSTTGQAGTDAPVSDESEAEGSPAEAVKETPEAAATADEAAAPTEPQPAAPLAPPIDGRRRHSAGARPKPLDLVPAIDPRAGRLVKDAPVGGVPTVERKKRETTTRAPGGARSTTSSDRAPGARRDGSRHSAKDQYARKRGKETFQMRRRGLRRRRSRGPAVPKIRPTEMDVQLPITVKGLAEISTYKAAEIIKILFRNHTMLLTPNSVLDRDTVEILSIELEIEVNFIIKETKEDLLLKEFSAEQKDTDLKPRAPIVTILGHVDHGKTTLLDYIRQSDVAGREAGGITQHISSCQVETKAGRLITFIDTPGHEAFTEMRARGAQVTDIVVLIVAGDDGVMPQTAEAISHAKAAGVEIIVAITKCDKDSCRPDRAKQQLAEQEIFVEGYGGDVSVFEVSGITGEGVPELLEHIALVAEVESDKFRANPDASATGTVLESQSNPKRGILTTVLVQNGTLRKGDTLLAGNAYGTVRGMFDANGKMIKEAPPSTPVEVVGLSEPPEAGEAFYEVPKGGKAKDIADVRRQRARRAELAAQGAPTSVEALLGRIDESKVESLALIVKADVGGSLQPLKTILNRLSNEEVRIDIIHSAVGPINESDVGLATASKAMIIGFNVKADAKAREKAKARGVDWNTYRVIYEIEDDVKGLMEGRLAPEISEQIIGHAEILAIFTFSKTGNIAGCRVRDGFMQRDSHIRVFRGEELRFEGDLATLRREKDSAKQVKEGFECGMTVKGFDDYDVGDTFEAYVMKSTKRTLDDVAKDARARERQKEKDKAKEKEQELAKAKAESGA